jgi:hypothetical protein
MTDQKVVFTPAEYMDSFDAACPQQAYLDLAEASPFTAPDGMPLVTRRDGKAPVYINYGVRAAVQLPLSFTPTA